MSQASNSTFDSYYDRCVIRQSTKLRSFAANLVTFFARPFKADMSNERQFRERDQPEFMIASTGSDLVISISAQLPGTLYDLLLDDLPLGCTYADEDGFVKLSNISAAMFESDLRRNRERCLFCRHSKSGTVDWSLMEI